MVMRWLLMHYGAESSLRMMLHLRGMSGLSSTDNRKVHCVDSGGR